MESKLHEFLTNILKVKYDCSEEKYKTVYEISNDGKKLKVCMKISRVSDKKNCLEFQRVKGDKIYFGEHFTQLKNVVFKDEVNTLYE